MCSRLAASQVREQVPLSTLLSWLWVAHVIEVDNAVEAAGQDRVGGHFRISLAMWTNALRFVDDDGITVGELRSRARASCNIGGLERWGWITLGRRRGTDGFGTHRGVRDDTVLRPTHAGVFARAVWPRTIEQVEARWRERFGDDVLDGLRRALPARADPMPWSPPELHPSDGFRCHVVAAGGTDVEGDRPLVALLGQALTAQSLELERGAHVALPIGANLLRVVGGDVVRVRDLPARSGVSKEAVAVALTFLTRRGLVSREPDRAVRLTPDGLGALDDHRARVATPDDGALRAALDAVTSDHTALAAGMTPPEGCWRAQRPYLAQTRRLLADPTGALPWHPMPLHRGAWPDGA